MRVVYGKVTTQAGALRSVYLLHLFCVCSSRPMHDERRQDIESRTGGLDCFYERKGGGLVLTGMHEPEALGLKLSFTEERH